MKAQFQKPSGKSDQNRIRLFEKQPCDSLPEIDIPEVMVKVTPIGKNQLSFERKHIKELVLDANFQVFYTNHLQMLNTAIGEMVYRFMVAHDGTINYKAVDSIRKFLEEKGTICNFQDSFFKKIKKGFISEKN